jgi:hypothetical protein
MRVLLLVCVSLLLRAQSDTQQKFTVSGTVVNAMTNEPVRGALVTLNGSQQKTALTGPDGHFQMDGVTASSGQIMAQRPGFDQQNSHQQHIKIDGNTEGITVKIMPLSKISGRIVDREGEPIEGISVRCIGQQILNGRKLWQPGGGTNSDEGGNFVIEDLKAGTYILRTQEKQLYFTAPQSEAARYIYPPTFYPDAATRDQAQHIELAAGQDMKVDMTLNSIRGARVTVRTVPPFSNVMARMVEDDDQFFSNQARAEKSGDLVFSAVAPGTWKIEARGPFDNRGGNEQPMYGQLEVQVGTADVDNLKLPLGKFADIPVTATGVQNAQVALQLLSKDGNIAAGSSPEPNGQMLIHSVVPGTYRVIPQFTGDNSCIKSIMSGSQDLLRDQLVVSSGSSVPPIQVIESNNCAQLTINTNSKENTWVLVASEGSGMEPRMLSGMGSGYTAGGLPDGGYKVCAFDDITDLEYTNPEALRDFKCQSIHLEAGQKSTVQLEVNERLPK